MDDARARLPGLLEEVKNFCVGRDDAESDATSVQSQGSEVSRKRRPLSALKSGTKRKSRTQRQQEGGGAEGPTYAEGQRGWAASLSHLSALAKVLIPEHRIVGVRARVEGGPDRAIWNTVRQS